MRNASTLMVISRVSPAASSMVMNTLITIQWANGMEWCEHASISENNFIKFTRSHHLPQLCPYQCHSNLSVIMNVMYTLMRQIWRRLPALPRLSIPQSGRSQAISANSIVIRNHFVQTINLLKLVVNCMQSQLHLMCLAANSLARMGTAFVL